MERYDFDLKDYLQNSIVTPDARHELMGYVNEAYFRLLSTLEEIPDIKNGKLLEIGANPYFLTLLIKKFRNYDISTTNYFGDNCRVFTQDIINDVYQEKHQFKFENVNIERDLLPYPEESFNVVVFGEVLEHLTENPTFALYNIHRILKKGGILVLSTPNVYRYENIIKYVSKRKQSIYDPYCDNGIYGRHNREYSLYEVEDVLKHTGFNVIKKRTINAEEKVGIKRLSSFIIECSEVGDYILIKAEKTGDFSWYYPDYLFRGKPKEYIIDDFIRMGNNCAIHLGDGWNDLETWDKGNIRWTKGRAYIYLLADGQKKKLHMDVFSIFDEYAFNVRTFQEDLKIYDMDHIVDAGWSEITVELPMISKGKVKVEITMKKPWSPIKEGINKDTRELGIAFRSIGLL